MKISFNELQEIDLVNMNGGKRIVKSKMFMNNDCKIIKTILEPNASIGKHTQKNNEFMYVISGQARVVFEDKEEIINKDDVHYCPVGSTHEIYNNIDEDLVLLDITSEKQ